MCMPRRSVLRHVCNKAREGHQNIERLHTGCIMGMITGVPGWVTLVFDMAVIEHPLLVDIKKA